MEVYEFYPENHKYKTQSGKTGISASGIVEHVSNEYDSKYWTQWKAWERLLCKGNKAQMKRQFRRIRAEKLDKSYKIGDYAIFDALQRAFPNKSIGNLDEIIKQEWKKKNLKSQIVGSAYHDAKEKESIDRSYEINPWTGEKYDVIISYKWEKGVKISTVDLLNLKKGYYPELIVYYDGIFGQIDRVWVDENRRFWIRDFKTNEEIKTENQFQKLKYPVAHLDDCNYNHYRIQLGTYAWILTSLDYKCQKLALDHFNKEYQFDYLAQDVEAIILDYKINNLAF